MGFNEQKPPLKKSGRSAQDKYQSAKAVPRKRKRKNSRRRKRIFLIFMFLFFTGTAATLSLTVFFPVEKIEVQGNEKYDAADIINSSLLTFGDNLFLSDTGTAKNNILKQFPYIYQVDIKKHIPSTIEIDITETDAAAYVSSPQGDLLLDRYGRALEYISGEPAGQLVFVEGIGSQDAALGETIPDEKPQKVQAYRNILEILEKQEIIDKIYLIDLSDEFNIKLNYEDRLDISLGDITSMERKIEYFKAVVAEIGELEKGTLDVSNPQKASFLPQR